MAKLKETVEIVSGMPPSQQALVLNGKALPDGATLAQAGVTDGDVIMAAPKQAVQAAAAGGGGAPDRQAFARDGRTGEAHHPEAFIQAVQGSDVLRNQLRGQMPMVVKAVENSDPVALQKALREVRRAAPAVTSSRRGAPACRQRHRFGSRPHTPAMQPPKALPVEGSHGFCVLPPCCVHAG